MTRVLEFSDEIAYDIDDIMRDRFQRNVAPYREVVMHPETAAQFDAWMDYDSSRVPRTLYGINFRYGTLTLSRREHFPRDKVGLYF